MDAEVLLELFVNFDFVIVIEEDISLLPLLLLFLLLKFCSFDMPELIKRAVRHLITLLALGVVFALKLL